MALAEGKRGLFPLSRGAQNFLSLGDFGEGYVTELLPRYYAANYNGLLFHFSTGSVTIASTHVSPLAAGTATPIIAIWNPASSGKNAVITKVGAAAYSGTLGAGGLVWNYASWTTPTTAALSTPVSGIMNGSAPSAMKVYSNAVTTSSLVGIFYKNACNLGTTGALAANGIEASPVEEDIGGDIIIPPGTWGALAAFAAGTSPILTATVSWLELPV